MAMSARELETLQYALRASRRVLALVGSGLSASSGLPTFRGAGGLWKQHDAMELATPEAFEADPGLVWQFYSARRKASLEAKPNKGHKALAKLARAWPHKLLTLTQNVDDLHERAGHPEAGLVHLHGSLFSIKCTNFDCNYTEDNNYQDPLTPALGEACMENLCSPRALQPDALPKCPRCGELLRPNIVWFGEPLPLKAIRLADDFISTNEVDVIIVIGMSAQVWPAAGYIEEVALRGGKVAVFNTDATTLENVNWCVEGDASVWLPKVLKPFTGS